MANQYTRDRTQRDTVYNHVMRNPNCTARQIHERYGIIHARVLHELNALAREGQVQRERLPGERAIRWLPSCDARPDEDNPIRIHRAKWEGGHQRDALLTAFFGAPR